MTTGVCCPTCPTGITPRQGQPCRDCEIDAMKGPRKAIATLIRDVFTGPSRIEPPQMGSVRIAPDKEPGQ